MTVNTQTHKKEKVYRI